MDRDTRSERWGEDDRQSPRSKPDSRKSAGIMRNLQKRKLSGVKPKNSFGMKEKQDYDFDELERLLLN